MSVVQAPGCSWPTEDLAAVERFLFLLSFREPWRALEIAQGLEANMPLGVDKISIELCRLELAKRDRSGRQQESGDDRESADASEAQRHIGTLESQYDLATAGLGLVDEACSKRRRRTTATLDERVQVQQTIAQSVARMGVLGLHKLVDAICGRHGLSAKASAAAP